MLRYKRTYPAHIRLKLLYELQILRDIARRLVRRAHHKAAAHLKACILQISETAHPVFKRKLRRVQLCIIRQAGGIQHLPVLGDEHHIKAAVLPQRLHRLLPRQTSADNPRADTHQATASQRSPDTVCVSQPQSRRYRPQTASLRRPA